MEVKVMAVAQYKGHSIKETGSVNLNFKLKYDQLPNSIQLLQMLNNDVKVSVKMADTPVIKLGMFRVAGVNIDGDGESMVKLNGLNDFIETDNLNSLVTKELFRVKFIADIEEEESEGEDDE